MADDVTSLQAMFPSIDVELIRDVYAAAQGSFDDALNTLLEMVDPSQADLVKREMTLDATQQHPVDAPQQRLPQQTVSAKQATLTSSPSGAITQADNVDRRAFQTEEEQLQDDADEALARQLAQQEQDQAYALALHQQEIERLQQANIQQRQQQQQQAQRDGAEEEEDFLDGVEKKFVALKETASKKFKTLFAKLNLDSPTERKGQQDGHLYKNLLDDDHYHDDSVEAELLPSPVIARQTQLPSPSPAPLLPEALDTVHEPNYVLGENKRTAKVVPDAEKSPKMKGKSPMKGTPTLQTSSTDVLASLPKYDEEQHRAFFGIEGDEEAGPPPP